MPYQICSICQEGYFDSRPHECPPKWSCWDAENGDADYVCTGDHYDESRAICAHDSQDAAAEYCRQMDEGEKPVSRTVHVRQYGTNGPTLTYSSEPEIQVVYTIS